MYIPTKLRCMRTSEGIMEKKELSMSSSSLSRGCSLVMGQEQDCQVMKSDYGVPSGPRKYIVFFRNFSNFCLWACNALFV